MIECWCLNNLKHFFFRSDMKKIYNTFYYLKNKNIKKKILVNLQVRFFDFNFFLIEKIFRNL